MESAAQSTVLLAFLCLWSACKLKTFSAAFHFAVQCASIMTGDKETVSVSVCVCVCICVCVFCAHTVSVSLTFALSFSSLAK